MAEKRKKVTVSIDKDTYDEPRKLSKLLTEATTLLLKSYERMIRVRENSSRREIKPSPFFLPEGFYIAPWWPKTPYTRSYAGQVSVPLFTGLPFSACLHHVPPSGVLSNRDPLHEVAHDLLLATVIEAGCAGVGVAGQMLHVFKRRAVLEQVRDDGHAEGLRRQMSRQ
jgi:hypothetical protein